MDRHWKKVIFIDETQVVVAKINEFMFGGELTKSGDRSVWGYEATVSFLPCFGFVFPIMGSEHLKESRKK